MAYLLETLLVSFLQRQVEIPVPADVTKRKTNLELDPAGAWMKLSFKNAPEFKPLEGKFKGLVTPLDSVWMFGEQCVNIPLAS